MTLSTEQYEALLARLNKLENSYNDIAIALSRLVTSGQVQQLLTIVQQDIANVNSNITEISNRLTAIEEEPLNS